MPELQELESKVNENSEGLTALNKNLTQLVDRLANTPAGPTPDQVFGSPSVRKGEDTMTSRGFSFMKMIGLIAGQTSADDASVEVDVANRLHQALGVDGGYDYAGTGNRFLAPLATSFLDTRRVSHEFRHELKSLVTHSVQGADPDEMNWIRRKMLASEFPGAGVKELSWLNELRGGSLVAPPEMGELIELLRNKEALINAGARVVPLPPQGRIKYPRQTSPSTTYWVGENQTIDDSEVGTGEVSMQAKKLAVLIKSPNELIRFASPAAEALMRDDMTKSLALGLDLAGLEGEGGDNVPRGVINLQDINQINSSDQDTNGDRLVAEDIYRFIAAVEESNAEFEGFIMRPKTLLKYYQLRSDAVGSGDRRGPFVFNLIREAGMNMPATLAGNPVTKSTQVSQVRAKGNATDLTYIVGGMWSDLLMGMFGAIEFAASTHGDAFTRDQTWVRGILSADIAARHDSAFVWMDNLGTQL